MGNAALAVFDEKHRFAPGNKSGGRAIGVRNKLGDRFLQDLQSDWEEHGQETIRKARERNPNDYLKVVAGLLPKHVLLQSENIGDMSDSELSEALDTIMDIVRASKAKVINGSGEGK